MLASRLITCPDGLENTFAAVSLIARLRVGQGCGLLEDSGHGAPGVESYFSSTRGVYNQF